MPLVIIDTETGGLEPHHPTIQVAAVAVDPDWVAVDEFEVKLEFNLAQCDPEALRIGPYEPAVWAREAKSPRDAYGRFSNFLRRYADQRKVSKRTGRTYFVACVCGHNIATFDLPRIQAEFERSEMFLPAAFNGLDTCQLWRWARYENPALPESGRLVEIAAHYGVAADGAHDALADCHITRRVAPLILRELQGDFEQRNERTPAGF